jgi:uncharacterized ubiquitin-like protein YukD
MIIKVQFGKSISTVEMHQATEDALVEHIQQRIDECLNVPKHKQKLIYKGKVLVKDKSLESYGITNGAKVMLMASGTLSQVRTIRSPRSEI